MDWRKYSAVQREIAEVLKLSRRGGKDLKDDDLENVRPFSFSFLSINDHYIRSTFIFGLECLSGAFLIGASLFSGSPEKENPFDMDRFRCERQLHSRRQ